MTIELKRARWVKRTEDNRFTIETAAEKKREVMLCDTCGIHEQCPVNQMMTRAEHFVTLSVRHCEKYIPCIGFIPPIVGIERAFNTLRVGRGWFDRLRAGDKVALVNTRTALPEGYAEVVRLDHGEYSPMLKKHASFNHAALVKPEGVTAVDHVGKIMQQAHGHFLNEQSTLTAIYLRRLVDVRVRTKTQAGAGQEG